MAEEPEDIAAEEIEEIIEDGGGDADSNGHQSDADDNGESEEESDGVLTIEPSAVLQRHSANIFSVDLTENLCASGGEDDVAYVWDSKSGAVVHECRGHKDSVTWVRFNAKETLLATGDMSGLILVWNVADWSLKTQYEVNELEWLLWHPTADILLAGSKDGEVWMWLIPTGSCKVFPGDGVSCCVGAIVPAGSHLCGGYEDGSVRVWNLKDQSYVRVESAAQQSPITCIDCHKDGNVGAVGLASGICLLFHLKSGKILFSFNATERGGSSQQPADGEDSDSVESVTFAETMPLLCVGTLSGHLDLWDINTHTQRLSLDMTSGVVKVVWLHHMIIAGCLDGVVRLVDSRNGEIMAVCVGNEGEILDLAMCKTSGTVMSGGGDNTCRLYHILSPFQ